MFLDEPAFLNECKFAKVVDTYDGPALLINGHVIGLKGTYVGFASLIAQALRNAHNEGNAAGSVGEAGR